MICFDWLNIGSGRECRLSPEKSERLFTIVSEREETVLRQDDMVKQTHIKELQTLPQTIRCLYVGLPRTRIPARMIMYQNNSIGICIQSRLDNLSIVYQCRAQATLADFDITVQMVRPVKQQGVTILAVTRHRILGLVNPLAESGDGKSVEILLAAILQQSDVLVAPEVHRITRDKIRVHN